MIHNRFTKWPRKAHRRADTGLSVIVVEHPRAGGHRPLGDGVELSRAFHLQPHVVKAGGVGGD
jgi:hypothetical protein